MAKRKATTSGGLVFPSAVSKPEVKPRPKITKATVGGGLIVPSNAPKPVLDSDYEFVFDPSGRESDEVKSLQALFADRTGGDDLLTQPDPQGALKASGVIGAPKGNLAGSRTATYSTAVDALDALGAWMDKNPIPLFGEPSRQIAGDINSLVKKVNPYVSKVFNPSWPNFPGPQMSGHKATGPKEGAWMFEQPSTIGERLGVLAEGVGDLKDFLTPGFKKLPIVKAAKGVASTKVPRSPFIEGIRGAVGAPLVADNKPDKTIGDLLSDARSYHSGVETSSLPALRVGIGNISEDARKELNVRADVGPFSLYNIKGDTIGGVASGQNREIAVFGMQKEKLGKPFNVSIEDALPTIELIIQDNLEAGATDEEIEKQLIILDEAQGGAPTSDLTITSNMLDVGPFSMSMRKRLVDLARSQGRDIAIPSRYTDEELAHLAFTRANGLTETTQSAARQLKEFSAIIPGIVAIAKTLATGDKEQIAAVGKSAYAPYAYFIDDKNRRGWEAAITSFVQERPLDALLITGATRGIVGRTGGAAARTLGGTGTSLPQLLINATPKPGSFRARLGNFAKVNRPISVKLPEVKRGDVKVPEVDRSLVVGYTGTNLINTVFSELFWWNAGRTTSRGGGSVSGRIARVASGRTQRGMRRAQNVGDEAAVQAIFALDALAKGLSRDQVLRLALELVHATERPDGSKFSLSQIADYWEGRTTTELDKIANGADNVTDLKANAARYSKQAQFFREAANTRLEQSFIDRAREAVRPLGSDNDTIVSLLFGAFDSDANPSGLRTVPSKVADLEVGHKIDIGPSGQVIPARVTKVEVLPDGTRRVTRQNILDPRDVNSFVDLGARPITRLESGVNSAKFVRQFIYWQEDMLAAAKAVASERTAASRVDTNAINAPREKFNTLNAQRESAAGRIIIVLEKMRAAEASGSLSKVRRFRKQYERQVSKLILILRDMEQQAILMGDKVLATNIRAARRNVVTQRGVGGRAPMSPDAGVDPKLLVPFDELAAQQARVAGSAERLTFTPSALDEVRQGAARDALNMAAGQEARAASLQERIDAAAAERAGSPVSAVQASRAAAELTNIRDRVVAASEAAVRAGDISAEFGAALTALIARFDFLNGENIFAKTRKDAHGRARRLFTAASATDRAFVLSTLGDLLRLVEDRKAATDPSNPPPLFSADEVALLRSAENVLLRMEQRAARYSAFSPSAAPLGFGGRGSADVIPDITEAQAAARVPGVAALERGSVLQERIAARRAIPSVKQLAAMERAKKRLLDEANASRREARRIVERGLPLVRTESITAALDATTGEIAVKIDLEKPVYFTPKQILNESKEEYIARVQLYGNDPVLWLGTRAGVFGGQKTGPNVVGSLDASPTAGIPTSRFKPLTGNVTRSGSEDMRNIWRNLILDTGTIRGALAMQREMRMLIEGVSIRITNVTKNEAEAMNRAAGREPDNTIDLSEAETVVWDSRDYVAFNPFDKNVRIRKQVQTGVADADNVGELSLADNVGELSLVDLFAREASEVDLIREGGDYYLIPKFLYNQMIKEMESLDYRLGAKGQALESFTKQWRNFTLNIFPRTGFANLIGSAALAAIAGAGPKSFYLAYRHLRYGDVPAPAQLRQRFGATLTGEAEFARARDALSALYPGLDKPLGGLAWWMNHMRQFNGISEDFGRLAVWYSRAYPEAARLADDSFIAQWGKMRTVSEGASDLLERFANNDPDFAAQAARFTDLAFEWVGDLHSGGALNANLRIAIPFQQWYRHILRLTFITMPFKYPGRTLFLSKVAETGKEYLREHGILPSWFNDYIPIFIDEKMIDGVPQEYITAWKTSNLNVFSAATDLIGSNGNLQWSDYISNILLPIWGSSAQLIFSLLGSQAQQWGFNSINTDVRDQYGRVIPFFSEEYANYSINQLIRGLPMSTIVASTAARAPESNIFFGDTQKPLKGDGFTWSKDVLPPDAPGRDFLSVGKNIYNAGFNGAEFDYASPAALMLRLIIGGGAVVVLGKGRVRDSQIQATYTRLKAEYARNQLIELQEKYDKQQEALREINGQ